MKEYQDNDGALQLNPYRIYVLMRDALEPIRPLLQSMQQDMELLRDGLFTIVLIELKELKNDRPHVFNTLYNRLIDRDVIVGAYNSNVLETYHIRDVNDREDVKNLFCDIISEREELNKVGYLRYMRSPLYASSPEYSLERYLPMAESQMNKSLKRVIPESTIRQEFISRVIDCVRSNAFAKAIALIDEECGKEFWKIVAKEENSDESLRSFFLNRGVTRMPNIVLWEGTYGRIHKDYSLFANNLSANMNFDHKVEIRFKLISSFVLYVWVLLHPELDVVYDYFDPTKKENEKNLRELYAIIIVLSGNKLRNKLDTKSADKVFLDLVGRHQYSQARLMINTSIKNSIQFAHKASFSYYEDSATDQDIIDSVAEIFSLHKEGEKKPQYLMLPKDRIHISYEFLAFVEFCKDNLVLQHDGMYRFAQNQNYTSLKRAIEHDIANDHMSFLESKAWAEFYKNPDEPTLESIRQYTWTLKKQEFIPSDEESIEKYADHIYNLVEKYR